MGNGPEVPGEWDSSGPGEPPAQLLRRAISHVESLLHRLENPADKPTEPKIHTPSHLVANPAVDPGAGIVAPVDATTVSAASPGDEDNVVELSRTAIVDAAPEPHGQPEREPEPAYVPLPGVSSTAQAEALRITLHAHEEAHRLRAEANGARAEAAAEGERFLVEARMLSDRLHVESRDTATELLAAAKNEAAAIIDAARAEAERIHRTARDDSDAARVELDAQAEQERIDAADAVLADAGREAECIRAQAREQGRNEAARLVEAEVAAAAVEGRHAVEASRARAVELLAAANDSVDDVRATMRRVIDTLGESMVTFNAAVGSVDVLRDAVGELGPGPDEQDEDTLNHRPLGLLFGAPRG